MQNSAISLHENIEYWKYLFGSIVSNISATYIAFDIEHKQPNIISVPVSEKNYKF